MIEIRFCPLDSFVRFRLLEDGQYRTDGLLSAANWEKFRAACPGLVFAEEEPMKLGGVKR
jgi:hypothetical protein